jgi:hypothetical protein
VTRASQLGASICQSDNGRHRHPANRPVVVGLWAAAVLLLVGCAIGGGRFQADAVGRVPSVTHIPDVPFFAQTVHQCGPAALAMVLRWSGVEVTPDVLIPQVYTPGRKGSLQSSLISAARRHDRLAYVIQGQDCLLRETAAGHPVLVLQNLGIQWLPHWHYAVVTGYDLTRETVELNSGRRLRRVVGIRTFENTWKRSDHWGLLVLPPGRMPACSEETAYLKAALGLQQAGRIPAAVLAFQSAADQWPRSPRVRLALGNALYAGGDLIRAADTFQFVCELDPADAPAFNNLAHVLARLGRWEAAERAVRHAIALGGPLMDVYRRTLQEILAQRLIP